MTPEEFKELLWYNIAIKQIEEVDHKGREHGFTVVRRPSDGTYWKAAYMSSGEWHTFDEEDDNLSEDAIVQVEPYEEAVVKYRPVAR